MYRQDWEALSKHVAYKTSLKQIWNLELGSRRREPRACAGTSCAQALISRGPSLQRIFSEHTEPSQGKRNINAYLTMRASVGTLPLGLTAQARVRARTCALTRARTRTRTCTRTCTHTRKQMRKRTCTHTHTRTHTRTRASAGAAVAPARLFATRDGTTRPRRRPQTGIITSQVSVHVWSSPN